MKVLISFNILDLDRALSVAALVEQDASFFIIGPLLIYRYGIESVKRFKAQFPEKPLIVKAQILERPAESVALFAQAGATWITVLAGARSETIHTATAIARENNAKIILDLSDACSMGQAALDAGRLGVEALMVYKPSIEDARAPFTDEWYLIKGNTNLPIFMSSHITRQTIGAVLGLEPAGVIIGNAVINADNPTTEIAYFSDLMKN